MRCVPARDFTVGKALAWRSSVDADVPYQRPGSVWSLTQQQLFIDSLINGYDVPKIYLHDLRGEHPTKVYAIVDGKQRLTTIWSFLSDGFGLAADFHIEERNLPEGLPPDVRHPAARDRFSDLHPAWQKVLRSTYLAVVLIRRARPDDIEDLFSRLNNGEPLNAAEKRNALGGSMVQLIRELARHPLFTDRLAFGNERYAHLDLAARFLRIEEATHADGPAAVPDLHAAALDEFVRRHRVMSNDEHERLKEWALVPLSFLARVFGREDPLLSTPGATLLYYLIAKQLRRDRRSVTPPQLREAVAAFEARRHTELERPDDQRDATFIEYTYLGEHGSNDPGSITRRREILLSHVDEAAA